MEAIIGSMNIDTALLFFLIILLVVIKLVFTTIFSSPPEFQIIDKSDIRRKKAQYAAKIFANSLIILILIILDVALFLIVVFVE